MALKFKTRGESAPNRKPKVYFSCHPADRKAYFEPLTDELLSFQNCAIWYEDGEESERDELFWADLKQMQLFVMPVTTRLLTMPCRAMDEDFAFAIENQIPVLPLMQEEGLEPFYKAKFGNLQYLSRQQKDATELGYEEKLKKYLAAVLLDDDTVKKIQAAFDAYIFLSYRKKDRLHAQELMRLIHKNEFCRDIAIWYDEFLTPGEDFNHSIREALEKSGLFMLAVTPSLLEPRVDENGVLHPNYIEEHEYPMAKKAGKPILPAEMVATDKEKLSKQYPAIPLPTDAHNEGVLAEALLEKVEAIAKKENDKNPEHNFFIGLAYLSGVDVEVDHEKAVSLITFAAENGVAEAIDKLIEMYNLGLGVDRDFDEAIRWHEKKITLFRRRYEESPTERTFNDLFWCIVDCGDAYNAVAKPEKAEEKYQGAQTLCEAYQKTNGVTNEVKRNRSCAYNGLGDVFIALGKPEVAKGYFEESLAVAKALAEETGTIWAQRDLSLSLNHLGDVSRSLGKPQEALGYYEESLAIAKALAEETGTVRTRRDLSVSLDRLGDVSRSLGKPQVAKGYYEESHDILKALAEETGTIRARRDLSLSLNHLGDVSRSLGKPEVAKGYYEESLTIAKALAEKTGTIEARRNLSVNLDRLGDVCDTLGKPEVAKRYYEESHDIFKALAEETGTVEARRDLSVSLNKLGDVFIALGKPGAAKCYYEESLALRKALAEETGTIRARRDLSISFENLGDVSRSLGKPEAAKRYYEESLAIFKALAEETGTIEAKRDLSISFEKLGDVCDTLGKPEAAKRYYEESLALRKALAEETGTVEARRDLSVSFETLGNVFRALGKPEATLGYLEESLALRKALAEETGTVEARRDLSISFENFGDVSRALGKPEAAKGYYEESLAIFKALAEETGTIEAKRDLSISFEKLGDVCDTLGKPEGAKDYYEESLAIAKALAEETGTVEAYHDLAISYFKAACVSKKEDAAKLLREAIAIMERLCEACPDVAVYKQHKDIMQKKLDSLRS